MVYKAKYKRQPGKPRTYHGLPVLDAQQPLHFVVTQQDCAKGKTNDPMSCAGAISIKRTLTGDGAQVKEVHVHRAVTLVVYVDKVIRYDTPHGMRDQLLRFDVAKRFEAGTYSVKPVAKSKIAARGRAHSPPDRKRGEPNGPRARGTPARLRNLGRDSFRYTKDAM
jgi:hypothetical protein